MKQQPRVIRYVRAPAAILILCGLFLGASTARADRLRVENVQVSPRDATTATVTFDISWENSWYHGVFHDAAWVFFKVRADDKAEWQHLRLSADKVLNPTGFSQEKGGTPLTFLVPDGEDGFTGLFLRRAADGVGVVLARRVTVLCDLQPLKGITDIAKAQVRGSGVEMIYVAEGPFYLGKGNEAPAQMAGAGFGGQELNWFYKYTRSDDKDYTPAFQYAASWRHVHWACGYTPDILPPFKVTNAGPIPTGKQKGSLWAVWLKPEDKGEIPAAFPNGYNAFYIMKFCWFTAGQYADFLNTLTDAQAKPRYYTGGHGQAIKRVGTAVPAVRGPAANYTYTATDPDSPCPWLSWQDGATFAAWAGMRPTTELEYEKASRGIKTAVPSDSDNMFWGLLGQGTRMYEREISVSDAVGRAFKGTHGRGVPELPADWPATPADYLMSGQIPGIIYRGDYFVTSGYVPGYLLTGGRTDMVLARSDRSGSPYPGWRAARTAPKGDTEMKPLVKLVDAKPVQVACLKQPMQPDGKLAEWSTPTAIIDTAALIYPTLMRTPSRHTSDPWRGASDLSAKAYLGWDGEALCIAAEVTDDRQFNTQSGETLYDGDCMQVGLINPDGLQWNFGLALTEENGAQIQQWSGRDDAALKSAKYAVVRDDEARVTRYELRIPMADLGLIPGSQCSYYLMFFDDDTGNGSRYRMQWAPNAMEPFKRDFFPRVVLGE